MHPCKSQSFTSKDGLRFTTLCVKDGTTTPPEHFVKLLPNTVVLQMMASRFLSVYRAYKLLLSCIYKPPEHLLMTVVERIADPVSCLMHLNLSCLSMFTDKKIFISVY